MAFNNFPYTDVQDLNIDWLLHKMKETDALSNQAMEKAQSAEDIANQLKDFVNDYFDNLDVQNEINNKIDAMVASGEFATMVAEVAPDVISNWLDDNITPTTPPVDSTLTVSGAAADAKVTGDKVDYLNVAIDEMATPDYIWTLGKTVNSSGVISDSSTGAVSDAIPVLGGETIHRALPVTDSQGEAIIIHVAQYVDGVFQNRVSLTTQGLVLDANTNSIRFNCSRARSTGTPMTAEDIEAYFNAKMYRAYITEAEGRNYLRGVAITSESAESVYQNLLANVEPNTMLWVNISWWTDGPAASGFAYIFTLAEINPRTGVFYAEQRTQIAVLPDSGAVWTRRLRGGVYTDWTKDGAIAPSYPVLYCFGDSITWGSIWDETQDTPYYQADYADQIPTRIASAIGSKVFRNRGVSGQRFIRLSGDASSTRTIGEEVRAVDLSSANIVTIGGGRNDSSSPLGNGDTATANDGTICGAVADILEYLTTNYPEVQIVVYGVTPQPTTAAHEPENIYTRVFAGGWSLNSYYEEMLKLCRRYGAAFVDWYDCTLILRWGVLSGGYSNGTQNWAHPLRGSIYRQMGNYLGGKIAAIYTG